MQVIRDTQPGENIFRGTDDLLQQMQYDRNYGQGQGAYSQGQGGYGQGQGGHGQGQINPYALPQSTFNGTNGTNGSHGSQTQDRPNFTSPMELAGQKSADQLLAELAEQRRGDFPGMNNPSYKPGGPGRPRRL